MENAEKMVQDVHREESVVRQGSYKQVCKSLESKDQPKVIIFSIPHGSPGDECIKALRPHMTRGDIILDCSNEHYANTERRQEELKNEGIYYVGCGVSGGYQSARTGPSMSPGGPPEALDTLMPLLRKVAAKDSDGKPCTSNIGPGGSGHYVKMVHNGIEQGMMSVIAEAWFILTKGLQLSYEEVATILDNWNKSKELSDCFVDYIGVSINKARDRDGHHVLEKVQDKVVQDVDETEGTGMWTCEEAVRLHVPAATILSAHLFRCASADLDKRIADRRASKHQVDYKEIKTNSKDNFIEDLRKSTYFCLLLCFAEGLAIIRKMDIEKGWNINYSALLHVWGAGSIIQAGHILGLLDRVCSSSADREGNLLSNPQLTDELATNFPFAKRTVIAALEADMIVPATSQSLEFYKYSTSVDLPTQFMEAELDYFGNHKFDLQNEHKGQPVKGEHHFEWKPAKGESNE